MANISMTETVLQCHPLSEEGFVDAIAVHVDRAEAGRLQIKYTLHGLIDEIHFPKAAQPERTDGLWKDTCFELFCGRADDGSYVEFNFAPTGQWAAYSFRSRRSGMRNIVQVGEAPIGTMMFGRQFVLKAELDLSGVEGLPPADAPLRAAISTVIEAAE